jgi:hypothetical protein
LLQLAGSALANRDHGLPGSCDPTDCRYPSHGGDGYWWWWIYRCVEKKTKDAGGGDDEAARLAKDRPRMASEILGIEK